MRLTPSLQLEPYVAKSFVTQSRTAIRYGADISAPVKTLEEKRLKAVLSYIEHIDNQDTIAALGIFAEHAVYERGNWPSLKGKKAIQQFYKEQRKLRGKHHIEHASIQHNNRPAFVTQAPEGPSILIEGQFKGFWNKAPIALTFEDYWVFDKDSAKAIYRKSWISQPNV